MFSCSQCNKRDLKQVTNCKSRGPTGKCPVQVSAFSVYSRRKPALFVFLFGLSLVTLVIYYPWFPAFDYVPGVFNSFLRLLLYSICLIFSAFVSFAGAYFYFSKRMVFYEQKTDKHYEAFYLFNYCFKEKLIDAVASIEVGIRFSPLSFPVSALALGDIGRVVSDLEQNNEAQVVQHARRAFEICLVDLLKKGFLVLKEAVLYDTHSKQLDYTSDAYIYFLTPGTDPGAEVLGSLERRCLELVKARSHPKLPYLTTVTIPQLFRLIAGTESDDRSAAIVKLIMQDVRQSLPDLSASNFSDNDPMVKARLQLQQEVLDFQRAFPAVDNLLNTEIMSGLSNDPLPLAMPTRIAVPLPGRKHRMIFIVSLLVFLGLARYLYSFHRVVNAGDQISNKIDTRSPGHIISSLGSLTQSAGDLAMAQIHKYTDYGNTTQKYVDEIGQMSRSQNADIRLKMAGLLSQMDEYKMQASDYLLRLLKDGDARVRQAAASGLEQLDYYSKDVMDGLLLTLEHDPELRESAATAIIALATGNSTDVVKQLAGLLNSKDPAVRSTVESILRSINTDEAHFTLEDSVRLQGGSNLPPLPETAPLP